jgi:hypothetical protein
MAIYYLKSDGDSIYPYDTEQNATRSMWNIRALPEFASTDTIILCDDVTELTFNGQGYNKICNIMAKEGLTTRPTYHYNVGVNGPWAGDIVGGDVSISGIRLVNSNSNPIFVNTDATILIDDCILVQNGTTPLIIVPPKITISNTLLISTVETSTLLLVYPNKKIIMDNCTVVSYVVGFARVIGDAGGTTECTDNIFYFPNRTMVNDIVAITSGATTSYVEANLYFTANSNSRLVMSGTDEIKTIFANPLFAETNLYTLSLSSPATGEGIDGVNIGWDQGITPQDDGLGHIGAFYFGPDYTNALIQTIDIPTLNITVVDYTRDSSLTTIEIPEFGMSVPSELSAVMYNPFGFNFSATPVVGSTPLKVVFQAYDYTPKDQYMTVWEAYEFWWWFDFASYHTDGDAIITTTDSITHIYCHPTNSGRKFDVKLCVKYRLKNR